MISLCSTLYLLRTACYLAERRRKNNMKCFFTVLNFVTDEQFASSVSAISEPLDESRDESWAIIGGHWTRDTGAATNRTSEAEL